MRTNKIAEIKQLFPNVSGSRFTIAMFYKFFIGDLVPPDVEKMIYLDSDIIVNLDIAELWKINLGDKIFATVPEIANYESAEIMNYKPLCRNNLVDVEDYFNAGVLLMNLKTLRTEDKIILDGIKFRGTKPNYKFFDQTII